MRLLGRSGVDPVGLGDRSAPTPARRPHWQHTQQMVPAAPDARLHHVGGEVGRSAMQRFHLLRSSYASSVRRQAIAEHIGDEPQIGFTADRALRPALGADVARRPDEFGVGIADLIATQPTAPVLVHEMPPGQAMVDHPRRPATQRPGREARSLPGGTHRVRRYRVARRAMLHAQLAIGHTGAMHSVWFGRGVADDAELRLCGDVNGKRALELGVGPTPPTIAPNAVTLALAGAKSIVIDPSADRIAALRHRADDAEVRVECHQGELAELGFVTSGSIDLAIATQTLDDIDDLPRLVRQVHRVLKPNASFVMAITHPVAAMFAPGVAAPQHRYGETTRSISELYMSFERANFHIDVMHELSPLAARDATAPTVLVLRARKEGV